MKAIYYFLIMGLLGACGKYAPQTYSLSSGTFVQCDDSSNIAAKVASFENQPVKVFSKTSLENGRGVSITAEAQCLKDHPEHNTFGGINLLSQNRARLNTKFHFDGTIANGYEVSEIEEAFHANPCLLAVTEKIQVRVSSTDGFSSTPENSISPSSVQLASTNDPSRGSQFHLDELGFADAHALSAAIDPSTPSVTVAVLDTGIDYNHPDLSCNMWSGNGFEFGVDLVNNDRDPMDDHSGSHGTHVAGLIGACSDNGIGGTGVAGNGVNLMAVKVMNSDGAGSLATLANGIGWAVENGAHIINMSVQAERFTVEEAASLEIAIQDALRSGVVIVGAAGNSSLDLAQYPVLPAEFSHLNGMISVASYDVISGNLSSFSNYGVNYIDIAAPGSQDSNSRFPADNGLYSTARGGRYTRLQGTSQAAPIVAGAAALVYRFMLSYNVRPLPALIEFYLKEKGSYINTSLFGFVDDGAALNFQAIAFSLLEDVSTPSPFLASTFGRCNR